MRLNTMILLTPLGSRSAMATMAALVTGFVDRGSNSRSSCVKRALTWTVAASMFLCSSGVVASGQGHGREVDQRDHGRKVDIRMIVFHLSHNPKQTAFRLLMFRERFRMDLWKTGLTIPPQSDICQISDI